MIDLITAVFTRNSLIVAFAVIGATAAAATGTTDLGARGGGRGQEADHARDRVHERHEERRRRQVPFHRGARALDWSEQVVGKATPGFEPLRGYALAARNARS